MSAPVRPIKSTITRGNCRACGAIVIFYLRKESRKAGAALTTPKLINALQQGLPIEELTTLQTFLGVPMEKLLPLLGISKATFHRRKAAGRLDPAESDRVVRFARLMGKAIEVFESEDKARQWLSSPQFGLGGVIPLDYAQTEVGAREVENLLGRIEHGVYS